MWHMVGDEHSLKVLAPQLLRFGIDSVLKILNERMTQIMTYWINESVNDEGVYRTAPATPGLLITIFPSNRYVINRPGVAGIVLKKFSYWIGYYLPNGIPLESLSRSAA